MALTLAKCRAVIKHIRVHRAGESAIPRAVINSRNRSRRDGLIGAVDTAVAFARFARQAATARITRETELFRRESRRRVRRG